MERRRWLWISLIALFFLACWISGAFATGWVLGRKSAGAPVSREAPVVPLEGTPSVPTATPVKGAEGVQPTPPPTPATLDELFEPFWFVWRLVHQKYVDQPVNDVELVRGAIRGMLEALGDKYTGYMDPQEFQDAQAPLEGEYEGIGAWVDVTKDYLTIIAPIPGSPAAKAGLKPGDQIIAVDGEDVTGVAPELVRRRILGPAGTEVRLTIRREEGGEIKEFDVVIKRARIQIPSVEYRLLEGDVGYIRLMMFGEKTDEDLRDAIRDLKAQGAKAFILDLRNNGGGYLNTAVAVASQFLPEGQVVLYEKFGDGTQMTYKAKKGGLAVEEPLVVLVNEGSASASEVVAGALQDHGRAPLVGEVTFGKGSVQEWLPIPGDGGAVRITVAYWLTPKERLIHEQGLTPDYEVPLNEEDIDWIQYEPDPETDPQLAKALEVLQERLAP